MNLYKAIIPALAAIAMVTGFSACDEDPELAPVTAPVSPIRNEVNTSILDLKTQYWNTERNFADTVGLTPEGKHVVIAGRVISCDSTGNIYKSLVIQDATAALAISLDTTKIYNYFPVGEEVVIDMTGQFLGKYNGLFQMGKPQPYQNTYEISFMKYAAFKAAASPNGFPEVEKLDTIRTSISQIKSWTAEDSIIKYQSQLIELRDVQFVGGGTLTWADNGANANRELRDNQGNTITVRNSAYASFAREVMPAGRGDVVCILSYYGTSWQILFRSTTDCHNFSGTSDNPDDPSLPDVPGGDGSADSPFSVPQIINAATGTNVWVTGYIVGWVEGASLSEGAHFETPAASESNILLAATPDETNVGNCIPVQLLSGTDARAKLNLSTNPDNLGKQVSLLGNIEKYFGVNAVKGTSGYAWGDKGGEVTPEPPADAVNFRKATAIVSGNSYVLVANGKVAQPLSSAYGYLKVADVTVAEDGTLSCPADYAFTFTADADKNYTIQDPSGKYVYMKDSYNSFNMDDNAVDGSAWTVTFSADGACSIKNVAKEKTIQYDAQYTSYGAYSDSRGTLPTLYEKIK